LLKLGSEGLIGARASDEGLMMNQSYIILFKALDRYVETNGRCPNSLSNLDLRDMPLSLDEFHYNSSNGACSIKFAGKYINFYDIRHFTERVAP
jgi:hypothetical protein